MSVTVNTKTLRLVRTSTEWASDNPVLPSRVQGFDSTVRKYKMGDGVLAWAALDWWSDETAVTPLEIPIVAGSPIPYNYPLVGTPFETGFIPVCELLNVDGSEIKYDIIIRKLSADNSIDIYGYPDDIDPSVTQDDVVVTLYR